MTDGFYDLSGVTDGGWATAVADVLGRAGWQRESGASLVLDLPGDIGGARFEEAENLADHGLTLASGGVVDDGGEPASVGQLVVLFDGRLATLKGSTVLRSAVDAARADLVEGLALTRAPALRVNGLRFGAPPEGPSQRSSEWQLQQIEDISTDPPDLTGLPDMLDYLHTLKAITGRIMVVSSRG